MQKTEPALALDDAIAMRPSAHGFMADTAEEDGALGPLLQQYWQAALRWWMLIAAIVAVCLGIGIIATMLKAPLYTTTSRIEISREQKNITNVEGVEQDGGYYDAEFYDTQYSLLKTSSLAERVARDLKLADSPGFFEAHGQELPEAGGPGLSAEERKRREEWAAGILLGGITIKPVANSRLVDISYTSRSPQWSTTIANAWPKIFIAANMDRQFATSADARRFLEQRLGDLRARMEQSEQALITFGSDRGIVKIGGSRDAEGRSSEPQTLVASNLEALNAALVEARTERIAAQSRAQVRIVEGSPEVLASSAISSLRARRSELAAEYARLLVQFEPGYPTVRALREQINALDSAIARETARINSARQAAYAEALQRENELAAQVQAVKAQFDQQQRDTIQYNIYQREVDTNRQLYDALLQRYKEIGVAGTVGATNVVVVDEAKVPGGPSSPNLQRNLMLALVAGLFLAGIAVVGLEMIDEGIRDPAEVEKLLQLPLLGAVPLTDKAPAEDLAQPKSDLAEAYFSVRTSLALATTHGLPKSLVVTSSQPGEGKSVTALALAAGVGRTGKRVLLIDADMRSPSLHNLTDVANDKGLSNMLAGEEDRGQFIHQTGLRDVMLLPAGPTPPSASELLASDRLEHLLQTLSQRFDHIVIDAPPIIGIADAPLLARAAEGSVFVIEAGSIAVKTIRNALKRLQVGDNHVFGAVVTKVTASAHGYGYGYGYGREKEEDDASSS